MFGTGARCAERQPLRPWSSMAASSLRGAPTPRRLRGQPESSWKPRIRSIWSRRFARRNPRGCDRSHPRIVHPQRHRRRRGRGYGSRPHSRGCSAKPTDLLQLVTIATEARANHTRRTLHQTATLLELLGLSPSEPASSETKPSADPGGSFFRYGYLRVCGDGSSCGGGGGGTPLLAISHLCGDGRDRGTCFLAGGAWHRGAGGAPPSMRHLRQQCQKQ